MKPFGWKIALYFALVFAAGAGVGALGTYQYIANKPRPAQPSGAENARKQAIDELRTRLKLTPEQVAKLDPIFDLTRKEFGEYRERHRDETKAIFERQTARLEAVLTPEQVPEFRKLHEEHARERAEHERQEREKAEREKNKK